MVVEVEWILQVFYALMHHKHRVCGVFECFYIYIYMVIADRSRMINAGQKSRHDEQTSNLAFKVLFNAVDELQVCRCFGQNLELLCFRMGICHWNVPQR